jgi:hypothetical protein
VLRKVLGYKMDDVTGDETIDTPRNCLLWTAAEIYFGDQIKEDEVGRECGTYGKNRKAYRVPVGKTEENWPLGRPRSRWKKILKWILEKEDERAWDWINLAQDRDKWLEVVKTIMDLKVQ